MEKGQKILYKAIELKRKSEETEQSLSFVNQQISELESFSEELNSLENSEERQILANIGKGVFFKAKKEEGEKLFVDVGAGILVRKTPGETKEIIDGQIKKFNDARIRLKMELESFAGQFGEMMREVEKLKKTKKF